jgi:hypothetical protein
MNCDRCKRQLEGTVHTKDKYRVDLFRLHTGATIPVVLKEDTEEEIKFFKLENSVIVVLCNKCILDPKVEESLNKFESPL